MHSAWQLSIVNVGASEEVTIYVNFSERLIRMLNIAVCGKFHYPKYLKYLYEENFLSNFYCSYKIGAGFGIPPRNNKNRFLKEYLYNLHMHTLGERSLHLMAPFYHRLWQDSVKRIFRPSEVNHFMIHGNCNDLISLCKKEGRITIGEAVNAHPVYQDRLLNEEARVRGVKHYSNAFITKTMLEEFDAVDYLLVSSQFVKRTFVEHGYDKRRIIVLPYGVDPASDGVAQNSPKKVEDNRTVKVLCVGQIGIRKGQYYLLKAIKSLNRAASGKRFQLTLVGRSDPDYMKCLLRLSEDFEYIRHVENSEMIKFMAGFDVFVLPSLEDGFSVVVTEALSAGLPVVTTKNNGAADIIENGRNGVVVPAASAIELKCAIERVVDEKMVGARKTLSSWKDYASQLKSTCQDILAEQIHG